MMALIVTSCAGVESNDHCCKSGQVDRVLRACLPHAMRGRTREEGVDLVSAEATLGKAVES